MSLHVEVSGQGEPLVMLHGWGMHGGIWAEMATQLAQDFEVHCVDLPGHGLSAKGAAGREGCLSPVSLLPSPYSLDSIVNELSGRFTGRFNLLGWSLGGIIAQRWAAMEPEKITRLALLASTPCFANRADWECGMPQETLALFSGELERDFAATLRRFLALQVRGSEGERELLAALRERLFSRGEPDLEALRGGLEILRGADLRDQIAAISQPVLLIAGERDKLTLPQASRYMAEALPKARLVEIKGAAHAPFLSHPHVVIEHLKSFLNE